MVMFKVAFAALALSGGAVAAPAINYGGSLTQRSTSSTGAAASSILPGNGAPAGSDITAEQILTIMPTSGNCAETVECRTAAQAAPFVSKAFANYGITSKAEQAALLGIMAFESGEFKFNTNQAGHVGQGTRNMQSGAFNLQYAQSIPQLQGQLAAVGTADLNAVRALVLPDQFSFASAAWFLTTQCSAAVRAQLQTGSEAGWAAYISSCVGTEPGPRVAYWQAAVNALGSAAGPVRGRGLEGLGRLGSAWSRAVDWFHR